MRNKIIAIFVLALALLWAGGATPPTQAEDPDAPLIVCIDTFENDGVSGCYEVATDVPPILPVLPVTE